MKKKISVRDMILIPVIILGIVSIVSNGMAIANIQNVNEKATLIADDYMTCISDLSQIQTEAQDIHKLALSHIIATDFETMITVVDSIKAQETVMDGYLDAYESHLTEDTSADYESLLANYDNFKHAIINLVAFSANNKTADAYACANGDVATYADGMQANISAMQESINVSADEGRASLSAVYGTALTSNIITIIISILAVVLAVFIVIRKVLRPLTMTQKELSEIISGIDQRQGDLTRRVTVISNDEIAELGRGINVFMEKLQHIFQMIISNSTEMDTVVNQVRENVRTSNDSASDLSAVTEELSATMQEVANNASVISDNADAVRMDVNRIAEKSDEMNEYSKDMRSRADELGNAAKANMDITSEKVAQIMSVLNQAIEDSRSVDQVDSLTNDILSIASQTNLLALNASIEAARAGEAGKGFAVVAEEIGQLANSSRETANRIQQINGIVTSAVHNLSEHAESLVGYMNESILPEFGNFVSTGNQYKEDATHIESVMEEFSEKTDELRDAVSEIANSIQSITSAIEEGVNGVTGAAQSTQVLVSDMDNITRHMDRNHEIAGSLQQETTIFSKL